LASIFSAAAKLAAVLCWASANHAPHDYSLCLLLLLLLRWPPQVGFHDERCRRYTKVARKANDILNRLEKTRRELQPDFKTEKEVSHMFVGRLCC
jgi:hypothetical protein